jgi:thioesterase domain-containing protein
MKAIARLYLDEISRVQPHGPYYLGGYCIGALVAFEMAHQLRTAGETVACLVGIEPDLGSALPFDVIRVMRERTALTRSVIALLPLRKRIRLVFEQAASLPMSEKVRYFARRISHKVKWDLGQLPRVASNFVRRFSRPPEQPAGIGTAAFDPETSPVARVLMRAQAKYVPRPYPGRMIIFRASNPGGNTSADNDGWIAIAKGGVEIHQIPGEHLTLFEPQYAPALAKELDAVLGASRHGG